MPPHHSRGSRLDDILLAAAPLRDAKHVTSNDRPEDDLDQYYHAELHVHDVAHCFRSRDDGIHRCIVRCCLTVWASSLSDLTGLLPGTGAAFLKLRAAFACLFFVLKNACAFGTVVFNYCASM